MKKTSKRAIMVLCACAIGILVLATPTLIRETVHAVTYASDPELYSNGHKYFSSYDHIAPRDDKSWDFMDETYYCSRGCSGDHLERTLRIIEKDMIKAFEEYGYEYKDYYLYKFNDYSPKTQYDKELEEKLEQLNDKRKYSLWRFYKIESNYNDSFTKSYGVPPQMLVSINYDNIKELRYDDYETKLDNQMKKVFYLFGYDYDKYEEDKTLIQTYEEDFKQIVMKFEELGK